MQQSTMSGEGKTTIVALWSMDDEMTTMRVDGWSFFPRVQASRNHFYMKNSVFVFFERALSHRHNSRNL